MKVKKATPEITQNDSAKAEWGEKIPEEKTEENSQSSLALNPLESSAEIVFSELNLEKWSIWEPSSSKKAPRARTLERARILADGSRITAKVEMGFTQHGNLSTRDQKIYYVLLKLWDDAGRPDHPVSFSLQKIARELGEEWGSTVRRSITRSLLQLRNVWFNWENSYFEKPSGEHLEILDTFNILSELTLARRTKKLHATTERCVFQFHRQILKNLEANYTTPLFLATVLSFKSEIAQLLYPRLDLLLSDKKHYERRTLELFDDLGLEGETYRHRSARKRVIEKALEELRGACLTTGCIATATIEPTKDDTDFKIVIRKGPRHTTPRRKRSLPANRRKAASAAPDDMDAGQRAMKSKKGQEGALAALYGDSEEPDEALLVRYFHQQFHGTTLKTVINPKELVQAARLIQQHGFSQAMALVDFALTEAPKTNYAPASLNGILQYEARFAAESVARESQNQRQRDRELAQRRAQEAQQARESALIDELLKRVEQVRSSTPEAFTAFLAYIEAEREQFLKTPVARRAKAETRQLLSQEYDRPTRRLELFVEFFKTGSNGATSLALSQDNQKTHEVSGWLQSNSETIRPLLYHPETETKACKLLKP